MVNQLQSNISLGAARQLRRGADRLPAARRAPRLAGRCPDLRPDREPQRRRLRVLRPLDARRASTARTPSGAFRDVAPVLSLHRRGGAGLGRRGRDHPVAPVAHVRRPATCCGARSTRWSPGSSHIRRHNPDLRWRHRTGNSYGDWLQVDADDARGRAVDRLLRPQHADRGRCRRGAGPATTRRPSTGLCTPRSGPRSSSPTSATTAPSRAARRPATCWRWRSGCCRDELVPAAVEHLAADIEKRGQPADRPGSSASRCCARSWPTTAGPTWPTRCCTRRSSRPGGTRSATARRRSGSAGTAGPSTAGSSPPR